MDDNDIDNDDCDDDDDDDDSQSSSGNVSHTSVPMYSWGGCIKVV